MIGLWETPRAKAFFEAIYGSEGVTSAQQRYCSLMEGLPGEGIRCFTAPGRTELGGNHTDHNRGKVLAASIHLDMVAAAIPRQDTIVWFRSAGYPDAQVDLTDLSPQEGEKGTTQALIRGVAAGFHARGIPVGGFIAHADSAVIPGSGLSSSAAVEVLLGTIFDTFYGRGDASALEIARIGQKAENDYFGKPSGLMDQTACASGGAVAIDFADPELPQVQRITFDLESLGYALCVVNTRGSHADLTADYASIPAEMQGVARFFGKSVLREVAYGELQSHLGELRKALGDRAVLRAIHFFEENRRVEAMGAALQDLAKTSSKESFQTYLEEVNQSGDSSWELLQNSYSPKAPQEQPLSIALSMTRTFFRETLSRKFPAACRVHGGGFAGTIQAYIPLDYLGAYQTRIEAVFGAGAVQVLRIRLIGAAALDL